MKTKLSNLLELLNGNQEIDITSIDMSDGGQVNVAFGYTGKNAGISCNVALPADKLSKLFSNVGKVDKAEKVTIPAKPEVAPKPAPIYSQSTNKFTGENKITRNEMPLSDKEALKAEKERREALIKEHVNTKTRRIKCPISGLLISSADYQANKKAGKYANTK